jgi:transposase
MFIDIVPNRGSPPAVLLRESWREGKKTKKRTVANLSSLPPEQVELIRRVLKGEALLPAEQALQIERSLPHGHVAAVLGMARKLNFEELLATRPSSERRLALALICARVLAPRSKLATARSFDPELAEDTLAVELGLGAADADALYGAMDWLLAHQPTIEAKLARRHLAEGSLILIDVTSTYFEGRTCPLARLGHSRDGRKDRPQIVFGLLTDRRGCPVAVEVFEGNTADPRTLTAELEKLQRRFGLSQLVLVGDRGLLTQARLRQEVRPAGLEWITALRSPQIRTLVQKGDLQLSLFDQQDLAVLTSAEFPGERLIACKNPLLAEERARKREDLLQATERELDKIRAATERELRPLRDREKIALRVGRVLGRFKMAKHFRLEITDERFRFSRDEEHIHAEAALDGIYVIRTSLPEEQLGAGETVAAYKGLSQVERAFRTMKGLDLQVRPIHHRLEGRVRAHVFLCMLAYYLEWHLRQALAPLLFQDEDPAAGAARRSSAVQPARRSEGADRKARRQRTADGAPVQSFRSLLRNLATLTKNQVRLAGIRFQQRAAPTPLQQRAFDLLGVSPDGTPVSRQPAPAA